MVGVPEAVMSRHRSPVVITTITRRWDEEDVAASAGMAGAPATIVAARRLLSLGQPHADSVQTRARTSRAARCP